MLAMKRTPVRIDYVKLFQNPIWLLQPCKSSLYNRCTMRQINVDGDSCDHAAPDYTIRIVVFDALIRTRKLVWGFEKVYRYSIPM